MKYKTTIIQSGNNTGIEIPESIIVQFNAGKRPPVIVTLNGYSYRSTVAVMGGKFLIPLSKEHREAAGVKGGQEVQVTLEHDTKPRIVDIPADLKHILDSNEKCRVAFEKLPPSGKKEVVRHIESAKTAATRQSRIARVIASLEKGTKI
jgi:hypothetical protein